jgi:hypothetical protein
LIQGKPIGILYFNLQNINTTNKQEKGRNATTVTVTNREVFALGTEIMSSLDTVNMVALK